MIMDIEHHTNHVITTIDHVTARSAQKQTFKIHLIQYATTIFQDPVSVQFQVSFISAVRPTGHDWVHIEYKIRHFRSFNIFEANIYAPTYTRWSYWINAVFQMTMSKTKIWNCWYFHWSHISFLWNR